MRNRLWIAIYFMLQAACGITEPTEGSGVGDVAGKDDAVTPSAAASTIDFEESETGGEAELTGYEWTNITMKAPFLPRDGAGALVYEDRMWLLGGWRPARYAGFPRICANDVWSTVDGADWRRDKPNTFLDLDFDATVDWEGRHTAGYVVFDGSMWIVGGDANQGHYMNDVWRSNDGVEWDFVNPDTPVPWGPRSLHYTVEHDGKIWVMGGQTVPQVAPEVERFFNDVWSTSDGVTWEKVEPVGEVWEARGAIGGRAVFKERMWVIGGGRYDTPETPIRRHFNDVWSSADGASWTRHVEHAPWSERMYLDVAVFDDKLWVVAGADAVNKNDVWFSADGETWEELPDTPWAARHATSLFVYDDGLWVVTGNNLQSDVWVLKRR